MTIRRRWPICNFSHTIRGVFYRIFKVAGDPLDYVRKSESPYTSLPVTDLPRNGGRLIDRQFPFLRYQAVYKH